jgi:hypothetical protein
MSPAWHVVCHGLTDALVQLTTKVTNDIVLADGYQSMKPPGSWQSGDHGPPPHATDRDVEANYDRVRRVGHRVDGQQPHSRTCSGPRAVPKPAALWLGQHLGTMTGPGVTGRGLFQEVRQQLTHFWLSRSMNIGLALDFGGDVSRHAARAPTDEAREVLG